MDKDHLLSLIDYNYWANGLIVRTAERLSEAQFTQPTDISPKSVREIMMHILFAEWIWRNRMSGHSPDMDEVAAVYQPEKYATLRELTHAWFDEEMMMRDLVESLSEEKLGEMCSYKAASTGEPFEQSYLQILSHVVNHGTQHRSEVALILTMLGHSPGDMDYVIYLRG